MASQMERRASELRQALLRRLRAEGRLAEERTTNGAGDLVVSLAEPGPDPNAHLRIGPRESVLIVHGTQDGADRREEPLDLRFDRGFCWDEMVCGDAEELAELLLQHTYRRLDATAG